MRERERERERVRRVAHKSERVKGVRANTVSPWIQIYTCRIWVYIQIYRMCVYATVPAYISAETIRFLAKEL